MNEVLSFKEWNVANPNVPFDQKITRYKRYLETSLIIDETENEIKREDELVQKYKGFLRRLVVLYKDDPEVKKLENIDFEDRRQLMMAIPIFSKKIKDISNFYKKKRKRLKKLKEEYSFKGSELGLENSMRNLFLNKYSKEGDYFDPTINDTSIVSNLMERDVLGKSLEIDIVELYNY